MGKNVKTENLDIRIVIGTRPSPLALKQVEEAAGIFGLKDYEIRTYDTSGDKDRRTPISEIEGTDFFTDSLDQALLKGDIDCAVHSAKDLPEILPAGLKVAAFTEPLDPSDALVSKNNLKLKELPYGAKIGASSARRKEQLKKFRSDFHIIDIRGNIDERLKKFEQWNLDGLIVATCALIRLNLDARITERIPAEILRPHPLQGALAITIRANDYETEKIFRK